MDSTELNKIAGAVIGAMLVFMLLGFFSNKIYGLGPGGHHGEEQLAFAVELAESDSAADDAPVAVDYAALVASADPGAGEKVFNKCKSCHKVEDGANGVGPHMWGVVGRDIASVGGYAYSDALSAVEGDWTLTELSAFLENPKGYAPGTKMGFAGLPKPEDRVNVIAWMNEADGSPVDLAEGLSTDVAAATEETAAPAASETTAPAASEETTETAAAPAASEGTAPAASEETAPAASEETAPAASEETTAAAPASEETAPAASEETTEAPAASEETTAVAAAGSFPAGDAAKGEKVFRKCKACHKVEDGQNGVGPHLWGVVNRDIASVDGYAYSDALTALPGGWTATELSAFLEKPKSYVAGTKMAFGGLKKEEDRINLITYLNEADGTPDPLQ